jgi:hypothetical protein
VLIEFTSASTEQTLGTSHRRLRMQDRLVERLASDDHIITQKTNDGGEKSPSLIVFEDTWPSFVAICNK